ncbi:MAG: VWA domain-containing protein [Cytophagales bacterium]|nr:VWA domain-containing protein [Cytophagales bacterium]
MDFAHPEWFWTLTIPLGWGLVFAAYRLWSKRAVRRLGGAALPNTARRQWLRFVLIFCTGLLSAVALLSPRFPETVTAPPVPVADVVFAVDVSVSMLAADTPPSRLARVRQVLSQTLAGLDRSRVGVVVYAAQAFPYVPLTDDLPIAASFIPAVQPTLVNQQGTRLAKAMETVGYYFTDTLRTNAVVFVLSDGENHDTDFEKSVQKLTQRGITVHTIGVGTETGGSIPLTDDKGNTRFKTDASGQQIVTRLAPDNLRRIAAAGRGQYFEAAATTETVRFITQRIEETRLAVGKPPRITGYRYLFQWLLGAAVVLLLIERLR